MKNQKILVRLGACIPASSQTFMFTVKNVKELHKEIKAKFGEPSDTIRGIPVETGRYGLYFHDPHDNLQPEKLRVEYQIKLNPSSMDTRGRQVSGSF